MVARGCDTACGSGSKVGGIKEARPSSQNLSARCKIWRWDPGRYLPSFNLDELYMQRHLRAPRLSHVCMFVGLISGAVAFLAVPSWPKPSWRHRLNQRCLTTDLGRVGWRYRWMGFSIKRNGACIWRRTAASTATSRAFRSGPLHP